MLASKLNTKLIKKLDCVLWTTITELFGWSLSILNVKKRLIKQFSLGALGKRVFRFQLLPPPSPRKRTLGIWKWLGDEGSIFNRDVCPLWAWPTVVWPGVSQVMLIPQYVCLLCLATPHVSVTFCYSMHKWFGAAAILRTWGDICPVAPNLFCQSFLV